MEGGPGGGELPVADCHLPTQRSSSCAKRTVGDGVVYCKVQFTFDFLYQYIYQGCFYFLGKKISEDKAPNNQDSRNQ